MNSKRLRIMESPKSLYRLNARRIANDSAPSAKLRFVAYQSFSASTGAAAEHKAKKKTTQKKKKTTEKGKKTLIHEQDSRAEFRYAWELRRSPSNKYGAQTGSGDVSGK